MKRTFYLSFIAFSLLLFTASCGEEDYEVPIPEGIPVYSIDPAQAESYNLNQLVIDYDFLTLELPEDEQFAGIIKVLFAHENVYVMDMTPVGGSPKVHAFDVTGRHQYTINRPGRGPGEYEYIHDFDLTDDHMVLVTPVHILFFDRFTGEFNFSVENNYDTNRIQAAHFFDSETGVAKGGRGRANRSFHQLKFIDINTNSVFREEIPFPSHAVSLSHSTRYLFETDEGLRARPVNSNIVYSIEINRDSIQVEPSYALDFSGLWIPESFLRTSFRHMNEIFNEGLHKEYIYTFDVFENEDILYVAYPYQDENYVYLFDKRTGRHVNISAIAENPLAWPLSPFTTYKDRIVGLIMPFDLPDDTSNLDPRMQEILESLDDDGTPVLVLAKFSLSD